MIGNLARGQISRPQKQQSIPFRYPAPEQGIDARVPFSEGKLENCIFTYNLQPHEQGMKVRPGYREWQIDVESVSSDGVNTIIPFESPDRTAGADKLFVATNEGIWDVTTEAAAPVLKVAFGTTTVPAGYGVFSQHIGNTGGSVMFYADSLNGLYTYTESTDTWAQTTGITGVSAADISFVTVHKQRVWLIERDTATAWYLPVGAIAGAATAFYYGPKFRHGGNLVGLYNWTLDGGDGVDDYFVAVSSSGDVLPYRGEDPSSADTWSLVGSFYIGEVPLGPGQGSEHGGELYLLSSYGLTSMSALTQGIDVTSEAGLVDNRNMGAKIASIIRSEMVDTIDEYGWSVRVIPTEGGILVSSPQSPDGTFIQYYYNIGKMAWGLWRGVPMNCFDTRKDAIYVGTADSRVMKMDINIDNVLITPPVGTNGEAIEFSILSSFHNLGTPGEYKQLNHLRPDFIAVTEPSFTVTARYDFNLGETVVGGVPAPSSDAAWDGGLWDAALWGGTAATGFTGVQGAWGKGRYVAVAMRGSTRTETFFIGWDASFKRGGWFL